MIQSACRYLKQSKSSLYSLFCFSIFILVSSTGILPYQSIFNHRLKYLSRLPVHDNGMFPRCYPTLTHITHHSSVSDYLGRKKPPRRFVRHKTSDWSASIKGCSIISIKKTVVLILN